MEKSEENKKKKESKLLDTAFTLFTEKGIKNTSIQDIVDQAGVAKGTFYLYFKDKYEIRDVLICRKAQRLFHDAILALNESYIENFTDQIIFVINYVIDELTKNPILLQFISKNLSWGVYNKTINRISDNLEEDGLYALFLKGIQENHIQLENPEVTLFMIIELTSSTCFNSVLYKQPLPIKEYKPFLYDTIRSMLKSK
jgi:hypothetical protein